MTSRWLEQGRGHEVRESKGGGNSGVLSRECMPTFFHPTENRLNRFVQFRLGYKKEMDVVIEGSHDKKFEIPPFHRLFVVQSIELHSRWSETYK